MATDAPHTPRDSHSPSSARRALLLLALALSLGLHLAMLLGPAWQIPELSTNDEPPLNATLAPPKLALPAQPTPPPPPKPRPLRPAPAHPAIATTPADVTPHDDVLVASTPKNHNDTADTATSGSPNSSVSATPTTPTTLPPPTPAVSPAPTFSPPPVVADAALPEKGQLRFIITRGDGGLIVGSNTYTWEHDDRHYLARSVSQTIGLAALFKRAKAVQESRGELTANGLRPLSFRNDRNGKVDSAEFDWQAGKLRYDGHEDALPPGAQDMLSMYYQVGVFVAMQGDAPLEMPIATGRKLTVYRFERLEDTHIFYRDGKYPAVHLRTRDSGDTIELWIARDVSILPVRIRLVDRKGGIYDQLAEETALTYNHGSSR
jgi:hypothetical protein